ncbi:MAG: circularly permuted type 2 ATP-grasp protein [Polyangiaceae bacterium]|nr:circularly permuted type 2 ATP-grasp protein [Polyangiaceae bacterium]
MLPTQFQSQSQSEPPPSTGGGESYDEIWSGPGHARAHQALLQEHLLVQPLDDLLKVRQAVERQMAEQAVTFNILGVPGGENRSWELDPIPWVIESREWAELSRKLVQRAQLLEAFLADCYGPQRMLREGVIPARVVLANPDFLRACHGWRPLGEKRLWLYAADLARDKAGDFHVFSDRAAAPTGAGYALENRLVLGRVLGDLFREYRVTKVRGFFEKLKACVAELAPPGRPDPRAIVLTTGMQDESSFEHAYLARYLGFDLMEGRDLSVRDGKVFLKTVAGLTQIDVILRRVPDAFCDPVELREDSMIGVPGLVEAAHGKHIGLANPLGASLIESPAMKAFLGPLCQALLGEDLLLPSVETHYLGTPGSLEYVQSKPEEFLIKPAFAERRGAIRPLGELSISERTTLLDSVKARPHDFVAERWPACSRSPLLTRHGLGAGRLTLRSFLCRDKESFAVMPGGFARLDSTPDGIFLTNRLTRTCKDVWIPEVGTTYDMKLPQMPDQRMSLRRGAQDLPSRLVDDIFWLGRYIERTDASARLIRAGFDRLGMEAAGDAQQVLEAILEALKLKGQLPATFDVRGMFSKPDNRALAQVLNGALFDQTSGSSVYATLDRIHKLMIGVRSRLSRDAWHTLRRLTSALDATPLHHSSLGTAEILELLDELLVLLSAATGATLDNMVRGHAWLFLDLGRRLERASATLELLEAMLPSGATRAHMECLLEVTDSLLTYRARYVSSLQVAPIVDLLLTDNTNPRSVLFQVETIDQHVEALPNQSGALVTRAEKRVLTLRTRLVAADIEEATGGQGEGLRQLVKDAAELVWQLSDDIAATWFSHAAPSRSLTIPAWVNEQLERQ